MEGKHVDQQLLETMAQATKLTERALGQVARIVIEQIHSGLEASNHVEAAERDMRSALRQLVLAERELRARPSLRIGAGNAHAPAAVIPATPEPR